MKFIANDFEPGDTLKFIRQNTGLTQTEFAKTINKGKDWVSSSELGRINFFFQDFYKISKIHNIKLIIKNK